MQRLLIVVGLLIALVGLFWPWLSRLPLGRLSGDIHIEREGFSVFFPLTTGIVISVVVSLLLWLLHK